MNNSPDFKGFVTLGYACRSRGEALSFVLMPRADLAMMARMGIARFSEYLS